MMFTVSCRLLTQSCLVFAQVVFIWFVVFALALLGFHDAWWLVWFSHAALLSGFSSVL